MGTGAGNAGSGDAGDDAPVPVDADRWAEDLARLHGVSTLPPGEPDERLAQWLDAGTGVVGADLGVVVLGTGDDLTVRALVRAPGAGPDEATPVAAGAVVRDRRVTEAVRRRATVALLGGPVGSTGGPGPEDLGPGTLVVSPLWVSGELGGAVAFRAGADRAPFSTWALALVDLVADGVARVLEHHDDVRALDRATARTAAMVDLIPDPIVRLDARGRPLGLDDVPGAATFDPCAAVRAPGEAADPATDRQVLDAVGEVLATGALRTVAFTCGRGPGVHQVEARFVPAADREVLCIVRDVTERHRAEQARAEQVAFEALVAGISTRLAGCVPAELDDAVVEALGEVAAFLGADVAGIDERTPDGRALRLSHRWVRPGHAAPRQRGQQVRVADLPTVALRLAGDGHVLAVGEADLPPDAVEAALAAPGDRAGLWVRLGTADDVVGVLGLTWQADEPRLGDEVVGLVRFAADAFHGAIRRRGVAILAEGQARVFESIARNEPVATSLLAARDLLADHTLGATVLVLTVDDTGLGLVGEDPDHPWTAWFAGLDLDLANPYGQAVVTGEPVTVADVARDPRFGEAVVPDPSLRAVSVLPVRSSQDGRTLGLVVLGGEDPAATVALPEARDPVLALVTVALERDLDARRLAHQATHDPLTGVGNRAALVDRLHLVLARARRSGRLVAVLFCDLDQFKLVNDRYGHDRGDRLLVAVAERITAAVRPSDTVSRTGGDEFVVVCEDLGSPEQAGAIAERIRASVSSTPVDLGGASHRIGLSVGLAIADPVLDDPDRILRSADLSMYAEKQRGRAGGFVVDLTDGPRPEPGPTR